MNRPQNIPVIYEDNHILVVVKPVNIPSQKDKSEDPDLLTVLKQDIKKRHKKPGNVFLSLVHRLDRPVGGVMVLARTSKAASRLSAQVRERSFLKSYLCVVGGVPREASARLENFLRKDREKNIVRTVVKRTGGCKKAVLEYDTLETSNKLSLLRVRLRTGRSHQIRVQLAAIGNPIYGDQRYGKELAKPGKQIALWSSEISFFHPTKGQEMLFTSVPPRKFPWTLFSIVRTNA